MNTSISEFQSFIHWLCSEKFPRETSPHWTIDANLFQYIYLIYLFTGYLWATEVWFPLNFELSFKALSSLSLYHAVVDGFSQRAAVFMFDFYIYRWVKPRTENRLLQIVSNVESVSFWVISSTLWKIISGFFFVFLSSKCCSQIVQNITFPVLKSLFNHGWRLICYYYTTLNNETIVGNSTNCGVGLSLFRGYFEDLF